MGDLAGNDTCVWGFYLHIAAYFGFRDPILEELCPLLLEDQMPDGGWNCRRRRVPKTHHSSIHTTFNVLDGLREADRQGLLPHERFHEAEVRAMELLLEHRFFRSDKTGEIIHPKFLHIVYPPRWHYDILRGLDDMAGTPFIKDPRAVEAIDLLGSKARDGVWPVGSEHHGVVHFRMESGSKGSRWNTLRALRVLRAV